MADASITIRTIDSDIEYSVTTIDPITIERYDNTDRAGTFIHVEHPITDALHSILYNMGKGFRSATKFSATFQNVDPDIYEGINIESFTIYACIDRINSDGSISEYFDIYKGDKKKGGHA